MRFRYGFLLVALALCVHSPALSQSNVAPRAHKRTKSKDAVISAEAMALLMANRDTIVGLKTYRSQCRTNLFGADGKPIAYLYDEIVATKPNLLRYEQWRSDSPFGTSEHVQSSPARIVFDCDGKAFFQQFGDTYSKSENVDPSVLRTGNLCWGGFFKTGDSVYDQALAAQKADNLREVTLDGEEVVDGVRLRKVYVWSQASLKSTSRKLNADAVYYIGPDNLIYHCVGSTLFGNPYDVVFHNVQANADIAESKFVYKPAEGVAEEADPGQVGTLKKGSQASRFRSFDIDNMPVDLSSLAGKVVVLDFWASWCAPCKASMAHTDLVIGKLQKEGLPVVALAYDEQEERSDFEKWVRANASTYTHLRFVYNKKEADIGRLLYRVSGIPTQYVIDGSRHVTASIVGYNGPNDDLEKAIREAAAQK